MGNEQSNRSREISRWSRLPDKEMIAALVRSRAQPSPELLARLVRHVAQAGFDPGKLERATDELEGLTWRAMALRRGDRIPSADRHYLKHVGVHQEWPVGTTLQEYLETARRVVLHSEAGIMASLFGGTWRLSFLLEAPVVGAHHGSAWVVVEYQVALGHWWSVYRPWNGPAQLVQDKRREEVRWLRRLVSSAT